MGAEKGSSVVLWDRDNYLQEASRQLCAPIYMRMLNLTKIFLLV